MANKALQAALQAVLMELQRADGMALKKGPKSVSVEVEAEGEGGPGMEECPECAAGTCTDPEHMSDDDMASMAEGY